MQLRGAGGLPRRRVCITPDLYEPQTQPRLWRAALAHYGVVADPCRVGDPNREAYELILHLVSYVMMKLQR